jgi:hypothetical protein
MRQRSGFAADQRLVKRPARRGPETAAWNASGGEKLKMDA